jgi:hypothetical protein
MTSHAFVVTAAVLVGLATADGPGIDPATLALTNATVEAVTWRGAPALKVVAADATKEGVALIKGATFHDGTIEVDVAGLPGSRANDLARGFIGVQFRIQPGGTHMETLYIRPTNGRSTDQLRRNHTVQYASSPDWPWFRTRKETPGLYETYADMEAGEWVHLKIVVKGLDATLYVGGATQPTLLVHDLKLGDVSGGIALFVGPGTDGYFKNLRLTPG